MKYEIEQAVRAASGYLLSCQAPDGHWEEYRLPVGPSDAWVTAYIGCALHMAGARQSNEVAVAGGHRAAAWLVENRPYPAGWGYNNHTGPDADSTAYALALIRSAGLRCDQGDVAWLLGQWQPGGGFATYSGPGAWGAAQVDITPACFRALPAEDQTRLKPDLIRYLQKTRHPDGTWPSYWWRTCFYSTYACLLLLEEIDSERLLDSKRVDMQKLPVICSAFDLACAVGLAALEHASPDVIFALTRELLSRQTREGGWPGGEDLRVTEPNCYRPWEQPMGRLYKDYRGLISTATAVSVLARLVI